MNDVDYYFDCGNSWDRTCKWIRHEHNELLQLLIIKGYSIKHVKFIIEEYFSEYKDEFARIRTITNALILLHILKRHVNISVCGLFHRFYLPCGVLYIVW